MKYLAHLLCLTLAVLTSGCFEMMEDIYVNKDGSGKYSLTVDMSSLLSDPLMGEMMKGGMKEEMGVEELEIDSLISVSEMEGGLLPEGLTAEEQAVLNRTEVRMQFSDEKSLGKMVISFPFKEMSELNTFQAAFAKLDSSGEGESTSPMSGGMGGLMSGGGLTGNNSDWGLSRRKLTRLVPDVESENIMEGMDEETMSMMKMFMTDAKFITTYHLPGRVKKCTIEDADVEGKTVVVSYDLLDMLEEQPSIGGEIKFKRK